MVKSGKKSARKKTGAAKKNKLGVKNSLVNNINARKEKRDEPQQKEINYLEKEL